MRLTICVSGLLVLASIFSGCSKSGDPVGGEFTAVSQENAADSPGDHNAASNENVIAVAPSQSVEQSPALQPTHADSTPAEVLQTFLAALQSDEIRIAEHLLTDRARFETKRAQMEIRRVPAADYQVGLTRFATQKQKVAHVESLWTDADESGQQVSFDITWVLHRHHTSWRVAGMLTAPAPNEPQVFLDFENPLEMVAKVGEVESGDAIEGSQVRQASFSQDIK